MQSLRHCRSLTRLVLVWFALFIGIAIAAPVVQGDGVQMVCAGNGIMKLVDAGDNSTPVKMNTGMHCPMCISGAALTSHFTFELAPSKPAVAALAPEVTVRITRASAPPLPSRGPPLQA